MDDEPVISYSLKEILGDISHKLDSAIVVIHGKADSSRVEALEGRVSILETHKSNTVQRQASREHFREWLIPLIVTIILTIFTVLQLFHV